VSNGEVHDVNGMAELCDASGIIYVLDRGYVDYKSLYNIALQGSAFVTRMKSNGAYKRIKNNRHEKDGVIISDVLIQLTGTRTKKNYPKPITIIVKYPRQSRRFTNFNYRHVVYDRFSRGSERGLWAKILIASQKAEGIKLPEVIIDSTTMKVRRHEGGQKGGSRPKGYRGRG
jgi:hypothetical protein